MSKPIPPIRKFMTTQPLTIAASQPMSTAHDLMRTHNVRHLPVLRPDGLAGVVSDGDLHLIESLKDVDPRHVTVEDAMTQDVYTVGPDAPLDEVVQEMAHRKLGSTIVVDNARVVGIFTTVDACRAFADMLHTRLAH